MKRVIPMNRAAFIIIGALIALAVGTIGVVVLSDWYAANYIRSDDDMNTIGKVLFLGFYPALLVIGAVLGSRLWRIRRAHRRVKQARTVWEHNLLGPESR